MNIEEAETPTGGTHIDLEAYKAAVVARLEQTIEEQMGGNRLNN